MYEKTSIIRETVVLRRIGNMEQSIAVEFAIRLLTLLVAVVFAWRVESVTIVFRQGKE